MKEIFIFTRQECIHTLLKATKSQLDLTYLILNHKNTFINPIKKINEYVRVSNFLIIVQLITLQQHLILNDIFIIFDNKQKVIITQIRELNLLRQIQFTQQNFICTVFILQFLFFSEFKFTVIFSPNTMLIQAEKANLSKLLQKYSFEHLRPIPQVYEITIPQTQHFVNSSSSDKRRKIYYKVKYEMKQIEAIEEAKKQLQKNGIKDKLSDELILKHVYCGKWNLEKTVNRLKQVVEYHKNQSITKLNQQTIKKLQMGSIYSYGHDKGMRPVVIMRVDKFNFNLPVQEHFNAVYYLMLVVLGYRMVPYHAEKYTMIMDFNDIAFADIPYFYLYDALQKMGIYYCGYSEKTLIYNSTGINNIWRVVSLFLPENQKKKIVFIPKGSEKNALQFIEEYELEKRYGGKLSDLTEFWPPKSTNQQFNLSMMEHQEDLFSVQNNEDYFQLQGDKLCAINGCQCSIF